MTRRWVMASEAAARLTELLTPVLGDWLYWPASMCAAGHLTDDAGPVPIGTLCTACAQETAEIQIPIPRDGDEAAQHAAWERRQGLAIELMANPEPAWVISRGAPKDLDDPGLLWAAWGRWLAAMGADAPTMQVYWSVNTSHWVGAWPLGPRYHYQQFYGGTPANALRAAWLAWFDIEEGAP